MKKAHKKHDASRRPAARRAPESRIIVETLPDSARRPVNTRYQKSAPATAFRFSPRPAEKHPGGKNAPESVTDTSASDRPESGPSSRLDTREDNVRFRRRQNRNSTSSRKSGSRHESSAPKNSLWTQLPAQEYRIRLFTPVRKRLSLIPTFMTALQPAPARYPGT